MNCVVKRIAWSKFVKFGTRSEARIKWRSGFGQDARPWRLNFKIHEAKSDFSAVFTG